MQKWQEVLSQQSRKQSRKRRHIGRVNWNELRDTLYVTSGHYLAHAQR